MLRNLAWHCYLVMNQLVYTSVAKTLLQICSALLLHSPMQKRQLVKMYHLGLSIYYDRMIQISTDVADDFIKFTIWMMQYGLQAFSLVCLERQ